MSEHRAELVTNAEGRQILRLPAALLSAGAERIAALESEVAALRARDAHPDSIARTGAAFEAWSRDQVATQQAALKASVDQSTEVGARIATALEALVQAIAAKQVSITVEPTPFTFAPTIEPAKVDLTANVTAEVNLPPPRERKITGTVDADGNVEVVSS